MLSKQYRVKKFKDFQKLFDDGNFKSANSFYIKFIENEEEITKVSVVVPKKVAKLAVTRNRIKRQLSEIVRLNYKELKAGYNIIVICKDTVLTKKYKELNDEWLDLIKKAELQNESN